MRGSDRYLSLQWNKNVIPVTNKYTYNMFQPHMSMADSVLITNKMNLIFHVFTGVQDINKLIINRITRLFLLEVCVTKLNMST